MLETRPARRCRPKCTSGFSVAVHSNCQLRRPTLYARFVPISASVSRQKSCGTQYGWPIIDAT
eukprot:10895805-Prorocentrum_lima.AAC.1